MAWRCLTMGRYCINDRILFDMAVVLAQSLARDAKRRRDCTFVRSVRLSGGKPSWISCPRNHAARRRGTSP